MKDSIPQAHEDSAIAIGPLVGFAAGLALAVVIALFVTTWLSKRLEAEHLANDVARHPMAPEREVPPEPRLQTSPAADLALYREREQRVLSSYGWIDRQAGVVHIPIERAMEVVLERGLVPHSDGESPHAEGKSKEH